MRHPGDDKQISPTVVGVADGQIDQLTSAYLRDFEFRGSFTINSSLFDHAQRYLSAAVPLREHFRCVPEISSAVTRGLAPEASAWIRAKSSSSDRVLFGRRINAGANEARILPGCASCGERSSMYSLAPSKE